MSSLQDLPTLENVVAKHKLQLHSSGSDSHATLQALFCPSSALEAVVSTSEVVVLGKVGQQCLRSKVGRVLGKMINTI